MMYVLSKLFIYRPSGGLGCLFVLYAINMSPRWGFGLPTRNPKAIQPSFQFCKFGAVAFGQCEYVIVMDAHGLFKRIYLVVDALRDIPIRGCETVEANRFARD